MQFVRIVDHTAAGDVTGRRLHPLDAGPANPFGLHDMLGSNRE